VVLAIFALAVWLLWHQLRTPGPDGVPLWQEIPASLRKVPTRSIVAAIGITIINYLILVGYDYLAVRFVGERLALWKVALASFAGYACSYNIGATLAGTTIRYRLYSAWGVPTLKILQLLVILGLTFWFGVFALAGVIFVFAPLEIPESEILDIVGSIPANLEGAFRLLFTNSRPFGTVLLVVALNYLAMSAYHRGSFRLWRWTLPVPPFKLSLYQVAIASADMLVAGWVLYVLFPPIKGGYLTVLAVYLVAYVLVVLSHVPGGWGVLEVVILTLVKELELTSLPTGVVAGLVIFRVIYFLAPLLIAAVLLGVNELALRRSRSDLTTSLPPP